MRGSRRKRTLASVTGGWKVAMPWTERGGHAIMVWNTGDRHQPYRWCIWTLPHTKGQRPVERGDAETLRQAESQAQQAIAYRRR